MTKGKICPTPNDHDFIIDDFNCIVCKKCKGVWMEITPIQDNLIQDLGGERLR